MRAIMPDSSRIDLVSILCSCAGHVAVFGGLILTTVMAPRVPVTEKPSRGMTVDLVARTFGQRVFARTAIRRAKIVSASSDSDGAGSSMPASATVGETTQFVSRAIPSDRNGNTSVQSGRAASLPNQAELSD